MMQDLQLYQASKEHHDMILELWEKSVNATHDFLREKDLAFLKQEMKNKYLDAVDLFVVQDGGGKPLAFMGISKINLEMLFVHPDYMRKGIGRALVNMAKQSLGVSRVDVNEQNTGAIAFYQSCGFENIGRSERDLAGLDYPILHFEINSSQAANFIDWNTYANEWENTPGVSEYAQMSFDILSARYDLKSLRVLDFGCGTGTLSKLLSQAGAEVVALDPAEKMIEQVEMKKLANVAAIADELTPESINKHAALQKRFDLVVATSVCAFLPDFAHTLSTIKSVLKPQAHFIQWDWQKVAGQADFGFSPTELNESYKKAKLQLIEAKESFQVSTENGSFTTLLGIAENK